MHIIHVEILSISVIYSVRFLSDLSFFMRYCTKALETTVIYNSAERCYLLINGALKMGVVYNSCKKVTTIFIKVKQQFSHKNEFIPGNKFYTYILPPAYVTSCRLSYKKQK